MKIKNFLNVSLAFVSFLSAVMPVVDLPLYYWTYADDKEVSKDDFQKEIKDAGFEVDVEELPAKLKDEPGPTEKNDKIGWYMQYTIFAGNYINDVNNYAEEVEEDTNEEDSKEIDTTLIHEQGGRKRVCGFENEPQNLLNHNCNIPAFGTELFQNINSIFSPQGIIGAERSSSVAGLGFGVPVDVKDVPVNPNSRAQKYSALELYGYDLKYTKYLGEWDQIRVSSEARLLANIGFWGKIQIAGNAIGKGLTNVLNKMWNAVVKFNISELWSKDSPGFADGVVGTVYDTSDANIVLQRGWNRVDFADTLYNAFYITDKQIIEKAQKDFLDYFINNIDKLADKSAEIRDILLIMPEHKSFPKFKTNKKRNTSESQKARDKWELCIIGYRAKKLINKKEKNPCGKKPSLKKAKEKEQFDDWKKESRPAQVIAKGKELGVDCGNEESYKKFMECWNKGFEKAAQDIIESASPETRKAIDDFEKEFFKNRPHLDPSQPIGHFGCGTPAGEAPTKDKTQWRFVYSAYNTRSSESLSSGCLPVRPSIKGALFSPYERGGYTYGGVDTRYKVFRSRAVSDTAPGAGASIFTKFFAQTTNSLLSIAFSNFIEFLEIDKILETSIKTFTDSVFFPLSILSVMLWALYTFWKSSQQGAKYGFKELLVGTIVWLVGVVLVFNSGMVIKLIEEVPTMIDNEIAKTILLDDNTSGKDVCATSGKSSGIRTMQCVVWRLSIFDPWVHGQFGTTYQNLNASNMSNSNASLVGQGSVNMGGGSTVNNWALFQLDKTKTGTITTEDLDNPTGSLSKEMYKMVDLMAGPNNGAKSDGRYLMAWAGSTPSKRAVANLTGIIVSFFVLLIVGGLAIAKMEFTIEMAMKLFFYPFFVILAIFPNGRGKLVEYTTDIIGILFKRIFVVVLLVITLNILLTISQTDVSYVNMAILMIGLLIATKIYWKELVNIINTSASKVGDVSNKIRNSGASKMLPRSARNYINVKKEAIKGGLGGAIGGAAAGAIQMSELRKDGLKTNVNEIYNGMMYGMKRGAGTSAKRAERIERRRGYGLLRSVHKAAEAGRKTVKLEFQNPSKSKLYTNVNALYSIVAQKTFILSSKIDKLNDELKNLPLDSKDALDKKAHIQELQNELISYKAAKNRIEAITRAKVISNDKNLIKAGVDTQQLSTGAWKADKNTEINKLLFSLDFSEKSDIHSLDKEQIYNDELQTEEFLRRFNLITENEKLARAAEKEKAKNNVINKTIDTASKKVTTIKENIKATFKTQYEVDMELYYEQFSHYDVILKNKLTDSQITNMVNEEFIKQGLWSNSQSDIEKLKLSNPNFAEDNARRKSMIAQYTALANEFHKSKHSILLEQEYEGLKDKPLSEISDRDKRAIVHKDELYTYKFVEEYLEKTGMLATLDLAIEKPKIGNYTITGQRISTESRTESLDRLDKAKRARIIAENPDMPEVQAALAKLEANNNKLGKLQSKSEKLLEAASKDPMARLAQTKKDSIMSVISPVLTKSEKAAVADIVNGSREDKMAYLDGAKQRVLDGTKPGIEEALKSSTNADMPTNKFKDAISNDKFEKFTGVSSSDSTIKPSDWSANPVSPKAPIAASAAGTPPISTLISPVILKSEKKAVADIVNGSREDKMAYLDKANKRALEEATDKYKDILLDSTNADMPEDKFKDAVDKNKFEEFAGIKSDPKDKIKPTEMFKVPTGPIKSTGNISKDLNRALGEKQILSSVQKELEALNIASGKQTSKSMPKLNQLDPSIINSLNNDTEIIDILNENAKLEEILKSAGMGVSVNDLLNKDSELKELARDNKPKSTKDIIDTQNKYFDEHDEAKSSKFKEFMQQSRHSATIKQNVLTDEQLDNIDYIKHTDLSKIKGSENLIKESQLTEKQFRKAYAHKLKEAKKQSRIIKRKKGLPTLDLFNQDQQFKMPKGEEFDKLYQAEKDKYSQIAKNNQAILKHLDKAQSQMSSNLNKNIDLTGRLREDLIEIDEKSKKLQKQKKDPHSLSKKGGK